MTTVTLDTLSNIGTIFLRDILRNNLTDRQSPARAGTLWIFKGMPEKRPIDYPFVILSCDSRRDTSITIKRAKRINTEFIINVEVWANKMVDRDVLADQIVSILSDPTKEDSNSDSIRSKSFFFKEVNDTDTDSYKTETELLRIKVLTVTFRYGG